MLKILQMFKILVSEYENTFLNTVNSPLAEICRHLATTDTSLLRAGAEVPES